LPYAIAWLTLLLTGPGPYSADAWLFSRRTNDWRQNRQHRRQRQRVSPAPRVAARMSRSTFVRGLAASVALAAGAGVIAEAARGRASSPSLRTGRSVASLNGVGANSTLSEPSATAGDPAAASTAVGYTPADSPPTNSASDAAPTSASLGDMAGSINGGASPAKSSGKHAKPKPTPTPPSSSTAPGNGVLLGNASVVPANQAGMYTDPASGDPALLIHLPSGRFAAFDAVCTHAGCTVQYDPSQQLLVCPCHGAMFDPAQNARVVAGPANLPLAALNVKILDNGDVYAIPG
jgi:Rieske Fe-S protein